MPRSNASRSSRASSVHEVPQRAPGEEISSEMLLADLMNSKRRAKPKLSTLQATNTLDDSGDTMSECGSTCSASTTSLTKDLTKSLKSKFSKYMLSTRHELISGRNRVKNSIGRIQKRK